MIERFIQSVFVNKIGVCRWYSMWSISYLYMYLKLKLLSNLKENKQPCRSFVLIKLTSLFMIQLQMKQQILQHFIKTTMLAWWMGQIDVCKRLIRLMVKSANTFAKVDTFSHLLYFSLVRSIVVLYLCCRFEHLAMQHFKRFNACTKQFPLAPWLPITSLSFRLVKQTMGHLQTRRGTKNNLKTPLICIVSGDVLTLYEDLWGTFEGLRIRIHTCIYVGHATSSAVSKCDLQFTQFTLVLS